jgi:hypothetical protein
MIGGIIMIFVAVWMYQSAVKSKVDNVFMWVAIGAVVFFAVQTLLVQSNVFILEAIRGGSGDANYERDLTSIGDRKNIGGFQGASGFLLSIFFELMPPFVGFLAAAFVRLKFVTKEAFSIGNLFSGIKEMFISIKDSFKNPQ